jgi:FkbM family methyltransferase
MKASTNGVLSVGKTIARVCALFKFALLNPRLLIPPIIGMAIEKVKRRRARIGAPFYNCITNRDDVRVVFDVGANIGDVALTAVRSFPNAHIYCFEPVSATYRILCENIKNYSDRITPYNFGFLNVSKRLDIHITSAHGASSILDQSLNHKSAHPHIRETGTESIEVYTLDSFMADKAIDRIDIVKIDVEGTELEVIEGGRETFRNKVDNVFVELSLLRRNRESPYCTEICKLLYDLGFMLINLYDVARYVQNGRQYLNQMDAFFVKRK